MGDQLPKIVCEECAFKLDELFDFREKCQNTENMFLSMLEQMTSKEEDPLKPIDLEILESHRKRMRNMNNLQNHLNETNLDEGMQTIHVMKSMDLNVAEQVVLHEVIPEKDEIEDNDVNDLEKKTANMVPSDSIALHLSDDLAVVGNLAVNDTLSQLEINYVTLIPDEHNPEMVQYYENVKYDLISNDSYETMNKHPTSTCMPHIVNNNISNTYQVVPEELRNGGDENDKDCNTSVENTMPSTSEMIIDHDKVGMEITDIAKDALLESAMNNFTLDNMGVHWYVCPFCNEAAAEKSSFLSHFEQHFCGCKCGLFFTTVELYEQHKKTCQARGKKVSVIVKEKKVKQTKVDDEPHNADNDKSKEPKKQPAGRQKWTPKVCSQCGKQYRTNYKLQEHMRKHTGEKPFQCSMCDKAFRSKIGLAQHTATHTGKFDYTCSTCGKGFQCKSYLIVHQRVHSDLKPYPCKTCGQNFKTKQSLLDHENRHLGVKPYSCEICGRSFITKGLVKSHQKIHSGLDNRQYPCEICQKMFVSKSYLNTHLRIHTGEKPYLCEVCGKGFLTRVDLKIHSTMHTGEKRFKCDVCEKVFARCAALRCHRRSHTGERPYRCETCGKTFTQFSPMAIHKRLHTGERPYECDVCHKTFVSRSTMMCHRKRHPTAAVQEELESDPTGAVQEELDSDPLGGVVKDEDLPNQDEQIIA